MSPLKPLYTSFGIALGFKIIIESCAFIKILWNEVNWCLITLCLNSQKLVLLFAK